MLPMLLLALLATQAPIAATDLSTATPESTMTAAGTFDVKMIPQPADGEAAGPFGRMLLDKQYHGALTAVSHGQMMAFQSATEGSAGYVAMEQVTGTLDGRRGSFVLQHEGLMTRGTPTRLHVTVVPDSGTDELAGLAGELDIIFAPDGHRYELSYTLDRP